MGWKTLDDMDLRGKTVLVRVDINVPVENGRVTDATRIDRIVPTLNDILAAGGKPVLLAHFGRPKGKVVPGMSLEQLIPALREALGRSVALIETLETAEAGLTWDADVLLMENIRFYPGEESNDGCLLQRCVFGGPPRACLDRSAGAHVAGLCGPSDAGRAERA